MPSLVDCISPPRQIGVVAAPAGSTLGPRRGRGFELVWMIEGGATYEVDGASVVASEGTVILSRGDVSDSFRWDELRGCRHAYVAFDLLCAPVELPPPDAWPVLCVLPPGDVVRPLFRHLLTYAARQPHPLARMTLAHLLASVVLGQVQTLEPPRQRLPEPVVAAARHIERTLDTDPTQRLPLRELAQVAHVTPEHLCRLFAGATGHTPAAVVRLWRLDRAAALLARSNLSVSEIATAVGFTDPFAFSKAFKRAFGEPPSIVRARVHAGEAPPAMRSASILDMTRPSPDME